MLLKLVLMKIIYCGAYSLHISNIIVGCAFSCCSAKSPGSVSLHPGLFRFDSFGVPVTAQLTLSHLLTFSPSPDSGLRSSDFRHFFSLPLSPIMHRIYLRIQPFVYEFNIGNGVKRVGIVGADNVNNMC